MNRTTAYHPQANGLCERFHRSMKAALMAGLQDDGWADRLPWILLGLRTAPKEDLQASTAELVYGQPLRVPGEFLPDATGPWSVTHQRSTLQEAARRFAPIPTSHHSTPHSYVPPTLRTAEYVFVRHDAHRGPLRPPYDGPFRVLRRNEKSFIVDIGGRPDRISIDRLKPAHLDLDQPPRLARPPRRGRPPSAKPPARPSTTPTRTARGRFGRVIRTPRKLTLPVQVHSGGAHVASTVQSTEHTDRPCTSEHRRRRKQLD